MPQMASLGGQPSLLLYCYLQVLNRPLWQYQPYPPIKEPSLPLEQRKYGSPFMVNKVMCDRQESSQASTSSQQQRGQTSNEHCSQCRLGLSLSKCANLWQRLHLKHPPGQLPLTCSPVSLISWLLLHRPTRGFSCFCGFPRPTSPQKRSRASLAFSRLQPMKLKGASCPRRSVIWGNATTWQRSQSCWSTRFQMQTCWSMWRMSGWAKRQFRSDLAGMNSLGSTKMTSRAFQLCSSCSSCYMLFRYFIIIIPVFIGGIL